MDESERMPASSFLQGGLIGQEIRGSELGVVNVKETTSSGNDSNSPTEEFQEISSSSLQPPTAAQQLDSDENITNSMMVANPNLSSADEAQDRLEQNGQPLLPANNMAEKIQNDENKDIILRQQQDQLLEKQADHTNMVPLVEMRDFLGVKEAENVQKGNGGILSSHIPGIQTPEGVNLSPKIGGDAQSIVDNLMKGQVDFGGKQSPKNVDLIGATNKNPPSNQEGIMKRGGAIAGSQGPPSTSAAVSSSGLPGGSGKSAGVDGKVAGVSEQNGGSTENDSFYKMYNKEIKVNQDEIPIILAELTDAAFNFIQREQYEKALILLQKTEGVLEKLGMLEECIFYLKSGIALVSDPKFYKSKKISMRNRKTCQECKLKLQLCAILSQNQNHTEALDNARASVKLSHKMFSDMEELCQLYIDKITYRDNLQAAHDQSDLDDNERVQLISMVLDSSPAKQIPKDFLEQSISLVERSSLKMCPVVKEVRKRLVNAPKTHQNSSSQANGNNNNSNEKKSMDTEAIAGGSLANSLDDQMLLNTIKDNEDSKLKATVADAENNNEDVEDLEDEKPDMRSVLGFLNQNEWIYNLNIGNIMQIQPISTREFLQEPTDEIELGRDSFLSKLSILTVAYFCMSTEMRFLLQSRAQFLKPEVKKERDLESEYWHAKALEIACTFLPSECPLLNHVLLSYQKHHDPTLQPIKEDEEQQDLLSVLRPLKGIDQSKYQPIVRLLPQVKVNLSPTVQRSGQADIPVAPKEPYISLKEILRQQEREQIEQVLNYNGSQIRRIANHVDQETQVHFQLDQPTSLPLSRPSELNENNPSFVAHLRDKFNQPRLLNGDTVGEDLVAIGTNSGNMLPFSLNESQAEPDSQDVRSLRSHKTTSTQKLKDEVLGGQAKKGSKKSDKKRQALRSSGSRKQNLARNSIEGLEQQIMNAVRDSPLRGDKSGVVVVGGEYREYMPMNPSGKDFHFDSQESLLRSGVDSLIPDEMMQANFGANNSQVYDQIVDKLIDDPRIDKRTLFQRMIAKLELEQNLNGQKQSMGMMMQGEIGQLKRLMDGIRPVNSGAGVGRGVMTDDIQVLRLEAQMSEEANLSQNVDKMSSHLNESSKEEDRAVSTQKRRFSGKKSKFGAKNTNTTSTANKDANQSDIIVSKSAKQLVAKVHDSRDSTANRDSHKNLTKAAKEDRFEDLKGSGVMHNAEDRSKHTSKEISKNASKTRKNRQKTKDRHATQQYHHTSQQQIKPSQGSAKIGSNLHRSSHQQQHQASQFEKRPRPVSQLGKSHHHQSRKAARGASDSETNLKISQKTTKQQETVVENSNEQQADQSLLFRDITDYNDPLNLPLGVNEQSIDISDNSIVEPDDVAIEILGQSKIAREESSSVMGLAESGVAFNANHQISIVTAEAAAMKNRERSSNSNKKSSSLSRPSTGATGGAVTQQTRSSSHICKRRRTAHLTNQAHQNQQIQQVHHMGKQSKMPRKQLTAQQLLDESQQRQSRSESSSKNHRFGTATNNFQQHSVQHNPQPQAPAGARFNQTRESSGRATTANFTRAAVKVGGPKVNNFATTATITDHETKRQLMAGGRSSNINHHPQRLFHNTSLDTSNQHLHQSNAAQQPEEQRLFQKLSQKRLSANRHNTSQQQVVNSSSIMNQSHHSQNQNHHGNHHMQQRHMTSKLKKLVSQKQIETGQGSVAPKKGGKGVLGAFSKEASKSLKRKHQVLNHTTNRSQNQFGGGRCLQENKSRESRSRGYKKSHSRSSGKKTYSIAGSSKKSKQSRSRSNPSHGEVQRSLQNELHQQQYSFDRKNTHEVVQQFGKPHIINIKRMENDNTNHLASQSIGDLQRQVLENQRTLLDFMKQKRANSSESRGRSGSQARKKSQTTAQNLKDLLPQKMKSLQSHGFSQPALNFHSQTSMIKSHSRSIAAEPKSKVGGNRMTGGARVQNTEISGGGQNKENAGDFRNNNRSQNANSLATFMKYISGRRATDEKNTMNKSLQYLRRQQKYSTTQKHNSKTGLQQIQNSQQHQQLLHNNQSAVNNPRQNTSKDKHLPKNLHNSMARAQTSLQVQNLSHQTEEQLEFKRKLKREVDLLRKRMGTTETAQIEKRKNSPKRKKSDSRKSQGGDQRSGSRNSRSRSPVQPSIARIPKKKSFAKLLGNQKNLNFTAAEVNKSLLKENLLNLSVGEVGMAKSNQILAKSNLLNRKVDNLLPGRLYNDQSNLGVNGADMNFLQELGNEFGVIPNNIDQSELQHQIDPLAGNNTTNQQGVGVGVGAGAHHSLSMFDSEINDKNKSQFLPLHHNFSQNVMQVGTNHFGNNSLTKNGNILMNNGGTTSGQQLQNSTNPTLQARILTGLTNQQQSGSSQHQANKKGASAAGASRQQLPQKKVNRLRQSASALGHQRGTGGANHKLIPN